MAIRFKGESYPALDWDHINSAEIDAIERVTGFTFPKIRRMGQTCVCEHDSNAHTHKDDTTGEVTDDRSCTKCGCDGHVADLPTRVSTAVMWVSIKRKLPTVTFKEVSEQELVDFADADASDEESPDPTNSADETPETATP